MTRMSAAAAQATEAAKKAEEATQQFVSRSKPRTDWTRLGSLVLSLLLAFAMLMMWFSNREVERALTDETVRALQNEVKQLRNTVKDAAKGGSGYLFRPRDPVQPAQVPFTGPKDDGLTYASSIREVP